MFQNNSIDIGIQQHFLEDLTHQLELNPDMKASDILEEFKSERCFKSLGRSNPYPGCNNFNFSVDCEGDYYTVRVFPIDIYQWQITQHNNIPFSKLGVKCGVCYVDEHDQQYSLNEALIRAQQDFKDRIDESICRMKKNREVRELKNDFWRDMGCAS